MRFACCFILFLPLFAAVAGAQAFCALRDPNRQIQDLFPDSDSYRSIVRTVGEEARRDVAARLPFTLHFNELGRHTVYVAQRGGVPLGLVHVRSEAGRFGLVEIAWALDLDLRVVDFRLQRCRDRGAAELESLAVRAGLVGAGFAELRALLDPEGVHLRAEALPLSEEARPLGAVLVRNALKTIAATESAWFEDVCDLGAAARARTLHPDAVVRALSDLYAPKVRAKLDVACGPEGAGFARERTRAWDLVDAEGKWLARLVVTRWRREAHDLELWWRCAPGGALVSVAPRGGWRDPNLQRAFAGLAGQRLEDSEHCSSAVDLAALEVLILCDRPAPTPLAK